MLMRYSSTPGMHALGWSQKQAGDFMEQYTGLSRVNIDNEVRRYIAVPGQACAYKIGQLEIRYAGDWLKHGAELMRI